MIGRSRLRRRRSNNQAVLDIPLTPLIDTALTLLVIFMVATPMMHNAIKVDLPESHVNESTGAAQDLVIYIDEHEKVFLNGDTVTRESLITALEHKLKGRTEEIVSIKGDHAIRYGKLVEVYDDIKHLGGIKHVALATKRVHGKTRARA